MRGQAFFAANARASRRIAASLGIPSDKPFWYRFEQEAGRYWRGCLAAHRDRPGRRSALRLRGGAPRSRRGEAHRGLRVGRELALNADVDETVVADARRLPFADGPST